MLTISHLEVIPLNERDLTPTKVLWINKKQQWYKGRKKKQFYWWCACVADSFFRCISWSYLVLGRFGLYLARSWWYAISAIPLWRQSIPLDTHDSHLWTPNAKSRTGEARWINIYTSHVSRVYPHNFSRCTYFWSKMSKKFFNKRFSSFF